MGAHSVIASLLGIPFNLKAATELTDGAALTAFYLFYADDALTGQLLVNGCRKSHKLCEKQ
jgi:hypothetical protein